MAKNKGGRPTIYSKPLSDKICELIATNTCGLKRLCALHTELPVHGTIHLWRLKRKEFSDRYAEAKRIQADLLAEECLDIADDSRNDWIETIQEGFENEIYKLNVDHVNRCRLRIDTRKWVAAKLLPKIYGDKIQHDINASLQSTVNELKSAIEKIKSNEKPY